MKSATARKSLSSRYPGWARWGSPALLISSAIFVVSLGAQTPGRSENAAPTAASSDSGTPTSPVPVTTPNYALEARFLPASVNQLVFDLSVTPHWFTLSDKFWYSYRTTDGTKYYIVDPLKKSKTLLWDNAKVAATLSTLTNFPYDAQHLPIKRLRLVDKDTHMRFEVEIRKDGVVPNEPEKKAQDDGSQQGNESEVKQNEDKQSGQQGQRGAEFWPATRASRRDSHSNLSNTISPAPKSRASITSSPCAKDQCGLLYPLTKKQSSSPAARIFS